MTVDQEFVRETLQTLVGIESINPDLDPAGSGEAEIAAATASVMESIGLEVTRHEPQPGRVSVMGRLVGSGGGRSLLLNAHYDTVGVEGMDDPFTPRIEDGRLYGRGAFDMKGSLAACLGAAKELAESDEPPAGDLLVAAVADEEYASLGTADLIPRYPVDGAIVTEPTDLEICRAHKGFVWLEVVTRGRAAHGSQPQLGVDANLHMGRVLTALEALRDRIQSQPGHPLLGPASLHAALLAGGSGLSTYADRSSLKIERRTLPGEGAAEAVAELRAILDRLAAEDGEFDAELTTLLERDPFEVGEGSDVVRSLAETGERILGRPVPHRGEGPWMDSALLAAAGVDTVVFGPAGGGAHAVEEWVELESVHRLAEILAGTARRYCRAPG